MIKNGILAGLGLLILTVACSTKPSDARVRINTTYGSMVVQLYDETPEHSRNFLRLAESGQYDSLLFHRVVNGFMIQGGDPNSLHAAPNAELGHGEIGKKLDAEIVFPQRYHKRGALAAAARQSDRVNPKRRSSGSQFYIVQGRRHTAEELATIEDDNNKMLRQSIFYEISPFYQDSILYYEKNGMVEQLADLQMRVFAKVDEIAAERGLFSFPDELREEYLTVGGTPHLDGNYTVFGEIIEGFDVLDSIAATPVDLRSRPITDIIMTMEVID